MGNGTLRRVPAGNLSFTGIVNHRVEALRPGKFERGCRRKGAATRKRPGSGGFGKSDLIEFAAEV